MAKNLQFQINYTGQGYLDSKTSVASISELAQKWDFEGQSVSMPTAFVGKNDIPYPVDFWLTPYGEIDKWEIKTMPAIETEEDLERFKFFVEDFKKELEYYPMPIGFEFLANGEKYVFDIDENEAAVYTAAQTSMDELINHTVELAVDDAVNKITSGASEAFDTLKEVEEWIKENSGKTADLTGYVKQEDLEGYVKTEELPSMEEYATKDYVDGKVGEIVIPKLDGYATEAWVSEQGFLTEHQDITGKQDVIEDLEVIREGAAKGATALQEVPEGYATEAWVGEQGFLTEHQDISGLATKEEVSDAIAGIEIPSVEGLATESWVSAEIAKAQLEGEDVDLSGYATKDDIKGFATKEETEAIKTWVGEQGFITEHQSLEGLATEQFVTDRISEIQIPETDHLATKEEVANAVEGLATEEFVTNQGYITEHQDISYLATKEEVNEIVKQIPSIDGLATETYVDEKVASINIPSIEGLATEAWVNEQGFLTEHQDITGKQDVIEDLEAIREGAAKGATALQEVPEGYATESWVSAEIAKAQLEGEDVDLSGYATKDDIKDFATEQYVNDKIAEIVIPTLDGYATEGFVAETVEGLATKDEVAEAIAGIEIPSVEGLASESYVDEKVNSIKVPSIEGLATEEWVSEQGFLTEHQDISGLATKEETEAVKTWVGEQGFLTEHQDITGKQDVIEDLEAIREGAAKGATALQEVPEGYATEAWVGEQGFLTEHQSLEGYATEAWVSAEIAKAQLEGEDVDLSGYATKEYVADAVSGIVIPTIDHLATKEELNNTVEGFATEAWVGEQGFLTEHQDITGKQDVIEDLETIREGAAKGATALQEVPEGYATEAWVGEQGFLTEHQDISGLATKEEVANAIAEIEIPSIEGLATEQFVTDEISKIEIPSIDHLATKEELADVSGSIKTVIEELLIPENAKDSLDTIEEISAWIQSHPEDAASMNAQIAALTVSAHTHENKDVLDGITAEKVAAWDAAETNAKGYADDEIAKLSSVYAPKSEFEEVQKKVEDITSTGGEPNVQSDWNTVDEDSDSFIKNKPDLTVYAEKTDLEALATKEEVAETIAGIEIPSVEGLASETWVKEQGFLTEHQSLEGYATEAWVGEQGFLTEHQDITGKQDVIEDLEAIREGAAKGATALQEVPEGYATEAWVGEQGFLTEHQDISGLATKEEVSEAVLSAQTYADSLVENLKPYDGGTAVDVVDYTVNVNVAEDGFLKVNEENELTVTGVTLDAAVTSKDITIEGGQWATAVKTVFTGGTVPAGTTWQSFLESMLCVEKFDTSYSMSKAFTVSCGTLGEGITGATNNSSVEVGTKVSLKSFEANPTTASQSYTVSTFEYGYKLGEDGTYNKNTSFKETLTPSLKVSNDALTATFTTFVDESGNTIAKISGNTSMGEVKMRVMDGTNKVVIAQTGDTYTASSAVTAGTIYVATNLKNYYKSDKKTPNTYTPSYASEDKTATASTTYTVTGYRNTFYGTTSKTDAADATFIRTLTKSNKAIAAGNTISFDTNSSDGHLRMVIASPRTIKSVKNQTGTQDLTALLVGTKATVNVGGVDNFAPISYNVYDYTWKGAFGNETWIITFA